MEALQSKLTISTKVPAVVADSRDLLLAAKEARQFESHGSSRRYSYRNKVLLPLGHDCCHQKMVAAVK